MHARSVDVNLHVSLTCALIRLMACQHGYVCVKDSRTFTRIENSGGVKH